MKIARLVFNPIQENTYIIWDSTLKAAIIDAGNMTERENEVIEKFIADNGLTPEVIINTHGHFDHLLGVAHLCERYEAPFAMSKKDEFLLANASASAELFGVRGGAMPEKIDIDLDGRESISFGETELKIIATPGHTPGHIALYEPQSKVLFTGDTLFRESIGRTDLPGGDYSWIMRSIIDNLLPLGDDVKIYPGHGDDSNIGHESMYNPFVVEVLNQEVNYKN
ncbi:MAG: MBL fold metallo-hydrolase [Alistipes sp.]|nr:MBL fold metallo-hydrolase [Alistipes sp.]